MSNDHTLRNIGIGMAAGAALGMMVLAPRQKTLKATAKKAARAVEDAAENVTHNLGM